MHVCYEVAQSIGGVRRNTGVIEREVREQGIFLVSKTSLTDAGCEISQRCRRCFSGSHWAILDFYHADNSARIDTNDYVRTGVVIAR